MKIRFCLAFLLTVCMLFIVLPAGVSAMDARSRLSQKDQSVYDSLKSQIESVASGAESSTRFEIACSGFQPMWTLEELGASNVNEGFQKLNERMEQFCMDDPEAILPALMADLPYDLYWFDKTASTFRGVEGGVSAVSFSSGATLLFPSCYNPNYPTDTVTLTYYYELPVSSDYGGGYTVTRTAQIRTQAQTIVNRYAGQSDYQKLLGYVTEICGLTAYNSAAANNSSTPYGDPWQPVYVFDGNNNTNVVCEGYAKAFKYLCDLTQFNSSLVDCCLVTGTMAGGTGAGEHMWNVVTMENGKSYLVDVTNCDSHGDPTFLLLKGSAPIAAGQYTFGGITYGYDNETTDLWPSSLLTLVTSDYVPGNTQTLTITTQPTDKTAAVGTQVAMRVVASGTGTLSYQWQYKNKTATTWSNASGKTATWNLTVSSVHYNFDFRCKVSDTYGNVKYSNVVHINPTNPTLTITTQPTDKTASVGTQVAMKVVASGTGTLSYQWQYKDKTASTWNNASGKAATWNLTVAAVHYNFDFRCKVSDTYGNVKYSNVVHINPTNPTLTITSQPTDKTAAVGTTAVMKVVASGTGTLSYQWQYKEKTSSTWNNASGKTATWNLTVASVHYGFDFRCKVSDTYGNVKYSNVVHINPSSPTLTITTQPTDKTAAVGTTAVMKVVASGTGTLSYQWQYKEKTSSTWNNASGKTATWNLTVSSVHYSFDFRCKVSDTYGNVKYSNIVHVNPSNPTLTITSQPTDKTAAVGTQVAMKVAASGTGTLTYQWQYKQKSASTWSNASGKTATWNLTVAAVHYGFDFRCKVSDAYGNVKYSNVVHVKPTLTITVQPASRTASVGTTVIMSVTASGTGTLSYQWQYKQKSGDNWSNASGASAKTANWTLKVSSVHYGFDFRCKITDTYGNVKYSNTVGVYNPN